METRAVIKKAELRDRLLTAGIVAGVAFVIGSLLLISPIHRLGWIVWIAGGFYAIGYLAGIDDWVSYVSGHCPNCSKLIRCQPNQKKIVCKHCQKPITVTSEGKEKLFSTEG